MNVKLLCSFAAGLLIATTISGTFYFLEPKAETGKLPTEIEMKDKLASSGYVIHTEEEWAEFQASKETASENKKVAEAAVPVNEKIVYRTFLNVSEGMTSIDVGNLLVKAKVIDNARTFFNEVEKKGVSANLRPGTYEVDSNMTIDQIISAIFK